MIAAINPCNYCGRYNRPEDNCRCTVLTIGESLSETTSTNSFSEITPEVQSNLNEKRMQSLVENSRVHKSVPVD